MSFLYGNSFSLSDASNTAWPMSLPANMTATKPYQQNRNLYDTSTNAVPCVHRSTNFIDISYAFYRHLNKVLREDTPRVSTPHRAQEPNQIILNRRHTPLKSRIQTQRENHQNTWNHPTSPKACLIAI